MLPLFQFNNARGASLYIETTEKNQIVFTSSDASRQIYTSIKYCSRRQCCCYNKLKPKKLKLPLLQQPILFLKTLYQLDLTSVKNIKEKETPTREVALAAKMQKGKHWRFSDQLLQKIEELGHFILLSRINRTKNYSAS